MAKPNASRTSVADTSVVDLDADLVGPGRKDLDILNGQRLAGLPGNGGLARNGLEGIERQQKPPEIASNRAG